MWKLLRRLLGGRPTSVTPAAAKPPAPAPAPPPSPPDLTAIGDYPPALHDPVDPREDADLRREVLWAARIREDSVPAFPAVAAQILERARDPEADLDVLVRLVQQEPAIAAEVLRFANSALYGATRPVGSVRDAVTRLGLREVTRIVATAALLALSDAEAQAAAERFRTAWSALRRHVVVSTFAAGWLALELRTAEEQAFLGGLLHDVGKTVVLRALAVIDPAGEEGLDDRRVAALMEGVHPRIGAAAIRRWGLPDWLAALAAHHHDPTPPPDLDPALFHLVRVASGVDELRSNPYHRAGLAEEVAAGFEALGLGPARQRVFIAQVGEFTERARALLADGRG